MPVAREESSAQGALVISLDFELAWGVFDLLAKNPAYRANLLGAREVIPRLLEMFDEYGVAATWATVGLLFAESREEMEHHSPPPELRPRYANPALDPYRVEVGASEREDPLHFAPSLIRLIASAPRQEIGSHTFSHYTALERGSSAESFSADLAAARAIAGSGGIRMRSLVMPRHQTRKEYLRHYVENGFTVHRGNEPNFLNLPRTGRSGSLAVRGLRLLDSYVNLSGHSLFPLEHTKPVAGLHDVPESRFLRPCSPRLPAAETLRRKRITRGMDKAAREGLIYHLWWHPHNFGVNINENLQQLRSLLERYRILGDTFGMVSLTMAGVAEAATAGGIDQEHGVPPSEEITC